MYLGRSDNHFGKERQVILDTFYIRIQVPVFIRFEGSSSGYASLSVKASPW